MLSRPLVSFALPRRAEVAARAVFAVVAALGLAAGALLDTPTPALAKQLTVPSVNYPNLDAALSAAIPGDTIVLTSGPNGPATYSCSGGCAINTPDVTLSGECNTNPNSTIIDPTGSGGTVGITVNADNVTIKCLMVQHGDTNIVGNNRNLRLFRVNTFSATDDNVDIHGDGFNIQNSTFQNAGEDGLDICCGVGSGVVMNSKAMRAAFDCFDLFTFATQIQGNIAAICPDGGFYLEGDGNVLLNNSANATGEGCFGVFGNLNVVTGNRCDSGGFSGFGADGNGLTFSKNTVNGAGVCFFLSSGSSDKFDANTANACNGFIEAPFPGGGIVLLPLDDPIDNPVVTNNIVTNVGAVGIYVACDTCSQGLIKFNTVTTVSPGFACCLPTATPKVTPVTKPGDKWVTGFSLPKPGAPTTPSPAVSLTPYGNGIYVDDSGAGITVDRNIVKFASSSAFLLFTQDSLISNNQGLNSGASDIPGFAIVDGGGNVINTNTANYNGGDGIYVDSSENIISANTVQRNGVDGIRIDGGDLNSVVTNRVVRNHGDGIENGASATNTTFQNNISQFNGNTSGLNNGDDCTSDGGIATNSGNSCKDGSNFAVGGTF